MSFYMLCDMCAPRVGAGRYGIHSLQAKAVALGVAVLSCDIVSGAWRRPLHMPRAAEVCARYRCISAIDAPGRCMNGHN
jgi:hypothetical protein